MPEQEIMQVEERSSTDDDGFTDEDVDELLVEEVSIDGMCGVY